MPLQTSPPPAKRGRPRGLRLHRPAVEHLLLVSGMTRHDLGERAGIAKSSLSEALSGTKGVSTETVAALADALGCTPAMIAPEIDGSFVGVRSGDLESEVPVSRWLAAVLPRELVS